MAITFSRSLRSLNADNWQVTLIGLVLAILLLGAWCIWFFATEIKFTATSSEAYVDADGFIVAEFAKDQIKQVTRGQHALFTPDSDQALAGPAVATVVTEIVRHPGQSQVQIRLARDRSQLAAVALWPSLTGQLEIIIERISPANLVLRRIGLSDQAVPSVSAR